MRVREGRVASHPYYKQGEFESSEGEALWRAREGDEVAEMKREAHNFQKDPEQYRKKQQHTQESVHDDGDNDDDPQQQNNQQQQQQQKKKKNQRKSQNGF